MLKNMLINTGIIMGTTALGTAAVYGTNLLIDMYVQPDTRGCNTDEEYAAAVAKHEKTMRVVKPIINCVEIGLIGAAASLGSSYIMKASATAEATTETTAEDNNDSSFTGGIYIF